MDYNDAIPQWAHNLENCAITVCDANCRIIFMNRRSRDTFARHGNLIGHTLLDYHNERAIAIIRRLLATGGCNCYTISKQGLRKMIYQTAWRTDDGAIGGLVELSMVIPDEMPHYDRG